MKLGINIATWLGVLVTVASTAPKAVAMDDRMCSWGRETTQLIQKTFWIPRKRLFAETTDPSNRQPAFMWGCGVQLFALAAAAKMDPAYASPLRRYVKALNAYWTSYKGVEGYDVQPTIPKSKEADRYYDDNAWIALGMLDSFETTKDPQYLDRTKRILTFVLTGEDRQLGGGLYWREKERGTKNTCSNGPAIVGILRLYQATGDSSYLKAGQRLYDWVHKTLQDSKDSLYFDHVSLNGKVDTTKWSYNTALMIRADCLLHSLTGQERYLSEAERMAKSAEARWVNPGDGGFSGPGRFSFLLAESLLSLYQEDKNKHWLEVVDHALVCLHENKRDASGYYSADWSKNPTPGSKYELIDQASAARAFWRAAQYASCVQEQNGHK